MDKVSTLATCSLCPKRGKRGNTIRTYTYKNTRREWDADLCFRCFNSEAVRIARKPHNYIHDKVARQ